MGRKHVFEGKIVACAWGDYLITEDVPMLPVEIICSAGGYNKTVRITVEVLENAGGAMKEAVQHES